MWNSKFVAVAIFLVLALCYSGTRAETDQPVATISAVSAGDSISLPLPKLSGTVSVEQAIAERRSVREISDAVLSLENLSQLLWSGQGITEKKEKLRATPSAGCKYPLEIYVFVGNVEKLPKGLYRYIPNGHKLGTIANYDKRQALARSIPPNQIERITESPVILVIGAEFERTQGKYGNQRGPRYVYVEAGACAENIALQAQALHLSTFLWGAFDDNFVFKACQMGSEQPILIMPIGYKQKLPKE
ncbi:MAG: nitroreductase [candidate division Zixibacteria bacterium CG_4_9_14_3_um_filter_46_8]|nr:MAG: nitroreductase [candidate division Zixibacteria bacterium CG_4_9_14_3_um_filter_46_8]